MHFSSSTTDVQDHFHAFINQLLLAEHINIAILMLLLLWQVPNQMLPLDFYIKQYHRPFITTVITLYNVVQNTFFFLLYYGGSKRTART